MKKISLFSFLISLSFSFLISCNNQMKYTKEAWEIASYSERSKMIDSFLEKYDLLEMNQVDVIYYLSTPDKIINDNNEVYYYQLGDLFYQNENDFLVVAFDSLGEVNNFKIQKGEIIKSDIVNIENLRAYFYLSEETISNAYKLKDLFKDFHWGYLYDNQDIEKTFNQNIFFSSKDSSDNQWDYSFNLDENIIYRDLSIFSTDINTQYSILSDKDYQKLVAFFQEDLDSFNNNQFYLKDLLPWINNLDPNKVTKIKENFGAVGVAPGSLSTNYYSNNIDDIKNLLTYLNSPLKYVPLNMGQICGGSYIKYVIYTISDTYSIYLNNNHLYITGRYYEFVEGYKGIQNIFLVTNSFITYQNSFKTYQIDGTFINNYNNLDQYEFIEYDGDTSLISKIGTIICEFGTLTIYSDSIFKLDDTFYKCQGDLNFSSLF